MYTMNTNQFKWVFNLSIVNVMLLQWLLMLFVLLGIMRIIEWRRM